MKTVQFPQSKFKYTLLEDESDITRMPLMYNLFGLNNRIYVSLGSINLSPADMKNFSKKFTKEELKYPLANRLFEVHVTTRTHADDYDTIKSIDFKDLFEFVKENHKKYDRIYADLNDINGTTDKELGIIYLPLNSRVLRNASNYAYQEMEKIKMENFMINFGNIGHLQNFLNIFQQ